MILFLIAVLGLFFIGSRRVLRESFDDPWSKDAIQALKGVFIHAGSPKAPGSDGWWFWAVFTAGICRISVPFFYASVPFLLYGFWSLMPDLKLPVWLEGVSFPIFVLHPFFVRLFNVVTGLVNDASVPVVLARVAIALTASILLTRLVKRFAPAAGEFLFGGR